MAFQSTINNHQSSIQPQVFHVDRKEISYLRFTLESYDGMAVVTTLDPYTALIEVSIAPGCEEIVLELLDSLRDQEWLRIKRVATGNALDEHFQTGKAHCCFEHFC